MKLSPIILFVYNRKWHTEQTIKALKKNLLASKSDLFIYSDGPKTDKDINQVQEIREYLKSINGFKTITIIEKKKNLGLAKSIIGGVTEIISKYGKAIILEDDLITSPYFLNFMNSALEHYKKVEKVWHISGWSYPLALKNKNDIYLYRTMNCWGWATWANNWQFFEKNTKKLINKFSTDDIKRFNLDGATNIFWKQVMLNHKKKIDTWAVYWYASIFVNNGLCLNPSKSFVKNIGFDGSGSHTFDISYKDNVILNKKKKINFDISIKEDNKIVEKIKIYFRLTKKKIFLKLLSKVFFLSLIKKIKIFNIVK
jgi:hypothetical protein